MTTSPFAPSGAESTVPLAHGASRGWTRLLRFAGPGMLVAVGYIDPGNWASDIAAGSRHGYGLLSIVILSSLAAIVLQCLCVRLGIATGKDLAQLTHEEYSPAAGVTQWLLAEISIVCCDIAEVLGCALALNLLFHISLPVGVILTAADTLLVLALQGKGFRKIEAIIVALVATVALCFLIELCMVQPDWAGVAGGVLPSLQVLSAPGALYLAVGIVGATVMPHNLYLHSSIVRTRRIGPSDDDRREAIALNRADTIASLTVAMLINAAILIVAAGTFHASGHGPVDDIGDAYHLLTPILGTSAAALVFGIGLLAASQSSTFTGTIAGQVIMDGFLQVKIPAWQRRALTRGLALIPALIGVLMLGDKGVGTLLVATQVALSIQLPFAMYPLIRFTSNQRIMGVFASGPVVRVTAWVIFVAICAANVWLIVG